MKTREFELMEQLSLMLTLGDQTKTSDIFKSVLDLLQTHYNSDWCILRQLNDEMDKLEIISYTGLSHDQYLKLSHLNTSDWVYENLVVQKKTIKVNNLSRKSPFNNKIYIENSIFSFIATPVIIDNSVLGTLKIYSKTAKKWKENDVKLLKIVAAQMSASMTSYKSFNRYRENYLCATGSIITLLDIKDTYTGSHSKNVANYSGLIAKQLKLSENEIKMIKVAATLHDIGKIIVSDNILNKAGKLTNSEYAQMKEHPAIGSKVLKAGGFIEYISKIVEQHHEKWDGTGYPSGISHNNISLGARIVSVADAFEAMTSERTYHKKKSHCEAIIEIKKCKGTQFCPDVVAAFLSIEEHLHRCNVLEN